MTKREYNRRYYLKHREKLIAGAMAYETALLNDPAKADALIAQRREQHARRMLRPEWADRRRDQRRKIEAKRSADPVQRKKRSDQQAVRVRANPAQAEKHRATSSLWQKNNPDAVRARKARRRARRVAAQGTYNKADLARILRDQEFECFWCCADITRSYHADHYIPLARGGSNWSTNIVGACSLCNLRKRDKTPDEFRSYLRSLKS